MKKRHLAMICGMFYPELSPTGLCAKRFVELLSDAYDIDIICISENGKSEKIVYSDSICIHTLSGGCMNIGQNRGWFVKNIARFWGGIQIKTQILGNLKWFSKAVLKKLIEIHRQNEFDVVFSICSPFAAHCAARDFKKIYSDVRWCGYTVDPYATQNRIRAFWCSYNRLISIEKNILLLMDSILVSEEVYENRKDIIGENDKCGVLPYVLSEVPVKKNKKTYFDKNNINCVYAGSFYSDLRNPKTMLELFDKIDVSEIKLHLFSKGCEDVVKQYTYKSKNIILHQCVSNNEIFKIYQEADFLVSVGNKTNEFMPSKTYEYIAMCKPIINFYYSSPDRVLKKYPISLQISNSDKCSNSDCLKSFILSNRNIKIDKKVVLSIYEKNSKEYVSHILHNAIQ